jgi:hypothetical protein
MESLPEHLRLDSLVYTSEEIAHTSFDPSFVADIEPLSIRRFGFQVLQNLPSKL